MRSDDSGPAATAVSPELKELRATCTRLDIKWHHRHKASTLQKFINDEVGEPEVQTAPEPEAIKHPKKPRPRPRPRRTMPQEISEALAYMNGYHRSRASKVREYIESLL